jgi:hypothetical protein
VNWRIWSIIDPMPLQKTPYLYQHYTWVELGEVAKREPVVVLPIGSVEDHGPHLPLDVDNFLIWEICEAAARRAEGDILLMPIIPYGFETHHMDFHGTIDIHMEHLLHFTLDVTKSVRSWNWSPGARFSRPKLSARRSCGPRWLSRTSGRCASPAAAVCRMPASSRHRFISTSIASVYRWTKL